MFGLWGKMELCAAAAFLAAGCGRPAECVRLDAAAATVSADVSDLSAVLSAAVTDDGRIDPAGLAAVRGRLEAQLGKMSVTGPAATPQLYPAEADRWAYWYNARAAWSLRLAADAGRDPPADASALSRRFPLDGRTLSLQWIDDALLAEAERTGDFRLAACAPGATRDDAPLPRRPLDPADFSAQLAETLDRLVMDPRRFIVDVPARAVRVPRTLWRSRDIALRQFARRYGPGDAGLIVVLRAHCGPVARAWLETCLGYAVTAQDPRPPAPLLAKPKVFMPGRFGRVEP